MGIKLGGMTLSSIFKKPETRMYPAVDVVLDGVHKGTVAIDVETCILCGICAKQCPAHAIMTNKDDRTWSIDRYRCVQCCACTFVCPKNSLTMEAARPVITTSKKADSFVIPEKEKKAAAKPASEDDLEAKLAKMDPEKAAKLRAAMEAKKKREQEKAE